MKNSIIRIVVALLVATALSYFSGKAKNPNSQEAVRTPNKVIS